MRLIHSSPIHLNKCDHVWHQQHHNCIQINGLVDRHENHIISLIWYSNNGILLNHNFVSNIFLFFFLFFYFYLRDENGLI